MPISLDFYAMQLGKRFIFFCQILSKPFIRLHAITHVYTTSHDSISLRNPFAFEMFLFSSAFKICCYLFECRNSYLSTESLNLMSLNNIIFVRFSTIERSFFFLFVNISFYNFTSCFYLLWKCLPMHIKKCSYWILSVFLSNWINF